MIKSLGARGSELNPHCILDFEQFNQFRYAEKWKWKKSEVKCFFSKLITLLEIPTSAMTLL